MIYADSFNELLTAVQSSYVDKPELVKCLSELLKALYYTFSPLGAGGE